ncbi:MAG: guanylate kinase, partial [Bacteroidota bacterium]
MAGKVFIVSAPSGAGKSTLVKAMLTRFDKFAFSISATTRGPRSYETEGVHYYFMSLEEFLDRKAKDEFIETEEVYEGRWYGTLRSEVDRIHGEGKMPIFDVDVEGGLKI